LIELLDLLLKRDENRAWRIASLELGGKWVRKKIVFCAFFVRLQGIVENELEVGGRGRGSVVSVRHEDEGGVACSELRGR